MNLVNKQVIYDKIVKRYPDRDTDQYAVGYADAINDVLKDIRYEPSAEPEIIRCKDCAWGDQSGHDSIYCANNGAYWNEEDYCNHAERRTDG